MESRKIIPIHTLKKNCAKVHILIGNYITRKIATKYAVVKVLAGALLWHLVLIISGSKKTKIT